MGKKYKFFHLQEFACPCCNQVHMNPEFLDRLDAARSHAQVPFCISSGFRCPNHNHAVGGKPDSAHLSGYAADILVGSSQERYSILEALFSHGFQRIGIGRKFIHVDASPHHHQKLVWGY